MKDEPALDCLTMLIEKLGTLAEDELRDSFESGLALIGRSPGKYGCFHEHTSFSDASRNCVSLGSHDLTLEQRASVIRLDK